MNSVEIPKFLLKLDFMLKSIAFIVGFSVLFMIVYSPFSVTKWFDIFDSRRLSVSAGFYFAAIAFMVVSKIAMARINGRRSFSMAGYMLWLLAEIVVISLLYTLFTVFVVNGGEYVYGVVYITFRAFCCVAAILAIPYTILWLYAACKSKKEEYEVVSYHSRLADGGVDTSHLVRLCDNNGVVRLTVDIDALYYMESQDNYVKICYENDGALHYYMLRCRTKTLEEGLAATSMMRCHRSYIINTSKIKLLIPAKSKGTVVLRHPNAKPIPVSKSYYDRIMSFAAETASAAATEVQE